MSQNQSLTLTLEPVMASQLVQMFGPSGTGLADHLVSSVSTVNLLDIAVAFVVQNNVTYLHYVSVLSEESC